MASKPARRHRACAACLGALLSAAFAIASAQSLAVPGKACQSVEHRQFDFWVGQWEVFVGGGKKAGDSKIELVADGCAILEQWSGAAGGTGKSLNIYDTVDRQWHQTWVDNSGTLLMLSGAFADRSMVMSMTGPSPSDPKTTVKQRIAWTPAADGSVRQLWESSTDAGRTWTVLFAAMSASSRPAAPPRR